MDHTCTMFLAILPMCPAGEQQPVAGVSCEVISSLCQICDICVASESVAAADVHITESGL
jgi:hypothetical protein